MLAWTVRRGSRATIPAPNQAPSAAAAIMLTRVSGSTVTAAMKISASVRAGSAWPEFRVPGMFSSGTRLKILKIAVVGAKQPMPSVSKKLVTKPVTSSASGGRRLSARARRRSSRNQVRM